MAFDHLLLLAESKSLGSHHYHSHTSYSSGGGGGDDWWILVVILIAFVGICIWAYHRQHSDD